MKSSIHSEEDHNSCIHSPSFYEEKFRVALDAWIGDIRKICQVIYGSADQELLIRINQVVIETSNWFVEQLKNATNKRRDNLTDMSLRGLVWYERHYIATLCPEELGRQSLMDSLDRHWSDVLLCGMCVAQDASKEEIWALMDKYQYLVYYAVKKRGNAPSSF